MNSLSRTQRRSLILLLLSLVSTGVFIAGCGASTGTSTAAYQPTAIATVPYLPPIVVAAHRTPTPHPTPKATPMPAPTAIPAATATPYVAPTATPPRQGQRRMVACRR